MIGRYHFTKGFFGANGIAPHSGCTTPDDEEAVCKRAAVGQCLDRFVLADSSKFGLSSHITFADLSMVTLITAKDEEHVDYRLISRLRRCISCDLYSYVQSIVRLCRPHEDLHGR